MRRLGWIAIMGLVVGTAAGAATPTHLVVHVPAGTPTSQPIYVAGSAQTVGGWKAAGLPLPHQHDGTFAGDLDLPSGQPLEYKITRGSWETVEKNADGSERANRVLTTPATQPVEITVQRWADATPAGVTAPMPASTVVGTLQVQTIDSKVLNGPRTVRVWLPGGYDTHPNTRYPVLYMQDGQNCFDAATSAFGMEWQIDETLTRLIAERRVPAVIVVGIDSGRDRISELTFDRDPHHGGGQGAAYARFVLGEVKPRVDALYRTQPDGGHTFVGGSSLGGLMALELARRNPGMFAGVIAMSPSVWWAGGTLPRELTGDVGGLAGCRVWIDVGTREDVPTATDNDPNNRATVETVRQLDRVLTQQHTEHQFIVDAEVTAHNERSWASRFPAAVEFLLRGLQ